MLTYDEFLEHETFENVEFDNIGRYIWETAMNAVCEEISNYANNLETYSVHIDGHLKPEEIVARLREFVNEATGCGTVRCTYIRIYNNNFTIEVPCMYNEDTGKVTPDIGMDAMPDGVCNDEFIILKDKSTIKVCEDCHSYVLTTVKFADMVVTEGDNKEEIIICSDPNCCEEC